MKECPAYVFLKPGVDGEQKIKSSVPLEAPGSYREAITKMKEHYPTNAKEISEATIRGALAPFMKWEEGKAEEDHKILMIYFHENDNDLRLAFRAITHTPAF